MKRSKVYLIFYFIILILFSCKNENEKEDFIGVWSSTRNTNFYLTFEFFKDSVVVHDPILLHNNFTLDWILKNKKIYGINVKNQILDSTIWDFKFNKAKDTLFIKHDNEENFDIELRKIENNFEHLENNLGFKLRLPETNKKLSKIKNNKNNFNVFLGKHNDSLVVKIENYFEIIRRLDYVLVSFLDKSEEEFNNISITLVADNSITNRELDSIKNIIRKFSTKKIYKVFYDKSYLKKDWKAGINWLGRLEDSIQ